MIPPAAGSPKTLFGQPVGLTVLFLTEMWEKFSFYGMRALLVYYMTKQLAMAQGQASVVYGVYTAFVYLTPIFGGILSDRWLGRRRSILIGGSVMAAGHFIMAFEPLFYPALACIALGNGLFLPSLPSQIGDLYRREDPRRVRAYNIYYVGVNLGAFLAPLVCGTLGELYGWHYGFGAAGIGMLAGLAIYVFGRRHLPPEPLLAMRAQVAAPADENRRQLFLLLAAIGCAVVVFRGAYEQIGNTLALWADTGIDRSIASGISIPMTWFQSLNPLLVFILTPFLLAHWSRLSARGREPRPLTKMALGAAGVALSYVMIAYVATTAAGSPAGWLWLAAFVALLTASELYILPVGLGLFARLAPAGMAATMIAAWFLAAFAGNLLAGFLGTLWSRTPPGPFFACMAAVAGSASLILWVLSRFARQAR